MANLIKHGLEESCLR